MSCLSDDRVSAIKIRKKYHPCEPPSPTLFLKTYLKYVHIKNNRKSPEYIISSN